MNPSERALLLSVHPRFATSILEGSKSVELRRQRVAVPAGTPVILYATSPVMALLGCVRVARVETASPAQVWRRHRKQAGISRSEYDVYMHGAAQASALLLESPRPLSEPVPLSHLRAGGSFHPPQSYRYVARETLHDLVAGHDGAEELLNQVAEAQGIRGAEPDNRVTATAAQGPEEVSPRPSGGGHTTVGSSMLMVG